ncbi:hypothetical protein BH11PSE4_BH11PSE4_19150 [soil metagenome]
MIGLNAPVGIADDAVRFGDLRQWITTEPMEVGLWIHNANDRPQMADTVEGVVYAPDLIFLASLVSLTHTNARDPVETHKIGHGPPRIG